MNTRVTFIGAGFSAALGYPVGANLPRELIRRLRGGKYRGGNSLRSTPAAKQESDRLLKDIEYLLEVYFRIPSSTALQERSFANQLDVTEFYSIAHTLSETPELLVSDDFKKSQIDGLRTLYSRVAAATRTYFTDICNSNEKMPPDIAAILRDAKQPNRATICFNWDEEVDYFLSGTRADQDVSYTLKGWKKGTSLLLKPHGSINWYDVSQGIYNENAYYIAEFDDRIPEDQRRLVAYEETDRPYRIDRETQHGVLGCPPAITPPTFPRRFNYLEQHYIWQDVITICSEATKFVFLGYRIPRDDYLTRAALRAALARNPDRLRVLAVLDDELIEEVKAGFRTVFPAFSGSNILQYRFGDPDKFAYGGNIAKIITSRLAKANV